MFNVLAIGAHPDDIELGCSGSLLKLKEKGCRIVYAIMTDGGNWDRKDEKIRIDEQNDACEALGVDKIYWMNQVDGNIKVNTSIIDSLESLILEEEIDIVFSNYKDDTHQDHEELYKIVGSATRFCANVFYFESLTSKKFEPNIYLDISNYHQEKLNVINKFTSQIEKYNTRNMNLIELINCKDRINGLKSNCKYAEGFIVGKANFDKLFLFDQNKNQEIKTFNKQFALI